MGPSAESEGFVGGAPDDSERKTLGRSQNVRQCSTRTIDPPERGAYSGWNDSSERSERSAARCQPRRRTHGRRSPPRPCVETGQSRQAAKAAQKPRQPKPRRRQKAAKETAPRTVRRSSAELHFTETTIIRGEAVGRRGAAIRRDARNRRSRRLRTAHPQTEAFLHLLILRIRAAIPRPLAQMSRGRRYQSVHAADDTDDTLSPGRAVEHTTAEFDALFRAHYRRICRVIYRIVGQPDLAESLAAEAFWKLHQRRPAAPHQRGSMALPHWRQARTRLTAQGPAPDALRKRRAIRRPAPRRITRKMTSRARRNRSGCVRCWRSSSPITPRC